MNLTVSSQEIEWKACVMVDLRIEPEALERVGSRYNEAADYPWASEAWWPS